MSLGIFSFAINAEPGQLASEKQAHQDLHGMFYCKKDLYSMKVRTGLNFTCSTVLKICLTMYYNNYLREN